jgi:hypothetical protein
MFAAKARQAIARGHNTLSKADSIVEAIDNWESTELEKVEAKAKLLGYGPLRHGLLLSPLALTRHATPRCSGPSSAWTMHT